ncbi:LysR substrate-binding domain-containing protein [Pseudomonas sp. NPDC086566]|uniref:LysR substrate-binding domain-containing protein n=1 Tax=Pseudomonas sp. NPDC086566 TaxID=3390647 RepID=UPI003D049612
MALPPLHSFKVFECVARLGSLAAAAVELHVTTGAISQQLKALQSSLGVELFSKRGRQLVLTSNGRQLHTRVAAALREINDAVGELVIDNEQKQEFVSITLSIPPAVGTEWLVSPLLRLMCKSQSLKVSVITAAKMAHVDWRRADVAVVYGTPAWPGYWWRELHGIRLLPVCSPQFLRGPMAIHKVEDLLKHRLLHEDDGSQWQRWLAEAGCLRGGFENAYFEDFGIVLQAAREGFGVALSDEIVSKRDLDEGKLVCPLPSSVPALHNYYVVCAESARECPEVRAFIDWLLETVCLSN